VLRGVEFPQALLTPGGVGAAAEPLEPELKIIPARVLKFLVPFPSSFDRLLVHGFLKIRMYSLYRGDSL
jgi:hypothetical protein